MLEGVGFTPIGKKGAFGSCWDLGLDLALGAVVMRSKTRSGVSGGNKV